MAVTVVLSTRCRRLCCRRHRRCALFDVGVVGCWQWWQQPTTNYQRRCLPSQALDDWQSLRPTQHATAMSLFMRAWWSRRMLCRFMHTSRLRDTCACCRWSRRRRRGHCVGILFLDFFEECFFKRVQLLGPAGPPIPLKNKGGYGGKLITVKIPQMKGLRTKVHNYLLPIYQSTIFAKLK